MAASDGDVEAGPSNKRMKLDSSEPIMDVSDMNKLFPKIDNLEHFPLKVLLNIFTRLDYIDLYNLAEKSVRFERIAKIVLNERYEHEYFIVGEFKHYQEAFNELEQGGIEINAQMFTIDKSKHNPDTYIDFFCRFGSEIQSIYAFGIDIDGDNHWFTSVLDKVKNLKKLTFDRCQIKLNENLLQQYVNENLTHLNFRLVRIESGDLMLSKFHNLKELEFDVQPLSNHFNTLVKVICNNPALERLVLCADDIDQPMEGQLMEIIGVHLKQLKEFAYLMERYVIKENRVFQQPTHIVDAFADSLKNLESLSLSVGAYPITDVIEFLRRLNSECKSLKYLKLEDLDGQGDEDVELFEVIKSFEHIECLKLFFQHEFYEHIESLTEHWPFLRHLEIGILNESMGWSFVLPLLHKRPCLELITVDSKNMDGELEMFGTSGFFKKFIDTIQNRDVKIRVKDGKNVIGSITKEEVFWRNMRMHWIGYDPSKNLSNIDLLDLANHQPNAASNVEQRNPFDLILGYLDLMSLYSLSNASEKCSQLVESYVKQHGTFTITNEFVDMDRSNFDELEMFADYVINLTVIINHGNIDGFKGLFEKFYKLQELYIDLETDDDINAGGLIVSQVRHFTFNGGFLNILDLYELSCICPDLETLQMDRCTFYGKHKMKSLKFRKLKKVTVKFDPTDDDDVNTVNKLKAFIKQKGIELCLIG